MRAYFLSLKARPFYETLYILRNKFNFVMKNIILILHVLAATGIDSGCDMRNLPKKVVKTVFNKPF